MSEKTCYDCQHHDCVFTGWRQPAEICAGHTAPAEKTDTDRILASLARIETGILDLIGYNCDRLGLSKSSKVPLMDQDVPDRDVSCPHALITKRYRRGRQVLRCAYCGEDMSICETDDA